MLIRYLPVSISEACDYWLKEGDGVGESAAVDAVGEAGFDLDIDGRAGGGPWLQDEAPVRCRPVGGKIIL